MMITYETVNTAFLLVFLVIEVACPDMKKTRSDNHCLMITAANNSDGFDHYN